MSSINYNCDDIETHLENDCEVPVLGGSSQCVLLAQGHTVTDPSNGTQINSNISSGKAILVRSVKIGMPLPTPIKTPSTIANETDRVVNYDRAIDYIDGSINTQNVNNFYNDILGGRKLEGIIIYEDGDPTDTRVTYIQGKIRGEGGRVIPVDNTDVQRFECRFLWRLKTEPTLHAAPTGVFVAP